MSSNTATHTTGNGRAGEPGAAVAELLDALSSVQMVAGDLGLTDTARRAGLLRALVTRLMAVDEPTHGELPCPPSAAVAASQRVRQRTGAVGSGV